ncbi:MAG: phospholipase D family protein [Clostridia bacterium]|nr:phospholipase D family protein [Clostridia bacterium]
MISKLINIIKKDKKFIWWFKSQVYLLLSTDKNLTIEDLLKANKYNYKEDTIKASVFELAKMNCLIKVNKHTDLNREEYKINIENLDSILTQCLGIVKYIVEVKERNLIDDYELITTLPDSNKKKDLYRSLKGKFRTIYDTILGLVANAKSEIIIINPFFDNKGIELITRDILDKLNENVKIKIVTRLNKKNRILLGQLVDGIKQKKISNNLLNIYDYKYEGDKFDSSTFHAKSIIIDQGKMAYIGSANLTGWGIEQQFELGILIKDKNAKLLYNIVEYIEKANIIERCSI